MGEVSLAVMAYEKAVTLTPLDSSVQAELEELKAIAAKLQKENVDITVRVPVLEDAGLPGTLPRDP